MWRAVEGHRDRAVWRASKGVQRIVERVSGGVEGMWRGIGIEGRGGL